MGIRWHLRLRMAEQGLFQTSDLKPLLARRGIHLSRGQVYKLVTQVPQRLFDRPAGRVVRHSGLPAQ